MGPAPAQKAQAIGGIHRGCIVGIRQENSGTAECVLGQGAPILVPGVLARYLDAGDEIQIPLGSGYVEIHVRKPAASRRLRELYYVPIGYVTRPKEDKRNCL